MNARRNPGNRLSASTKSRVLVTGLANLQDHGLVGIKDWTQLLERVNTQTMIGLKETNPLDSIVALQPATWGERGFDSVTQVFTWVLGDAQQRPLLLEIPFEEYTEPAINILEEVSAESLRGALLIGRIQQSPRGLSLHPYSIHRQDGEIVHLCLDNAKPVAASVTAVRAEDENGFESEEETEAIAAFSPALGRLLDEVDDGLLALAEGGLAGLNPLRVERIRQVIPRADRLGLSGLASGLGQLGHRAEPRSVLRCVYIGQLHRRAMPVSTST
jgi:hypothetical protein